MGYGPNTLTTAPLRWYNIDGLLRVGRRRPSAAGPALASILQWAPVSEAAIAQLGERETEDLKVPSSILGLGNCGEGVSFFAVLFVRAGCTQSSNVARKGWRPHQSGNAHEVTPGQDRTGDLQRVGLTS